MLSGLAGMRIEVGIPFGVGEQPGVGMSWRYQSRTGRRVVCAAGGRNDEGPVPQSRKQQAQQQVVGEMVDGEGRLETVDGPRGDVAPDHPGVQHEPVDRVAALANRRRERTN